MPARRFVLAVLFGAPLLLSGCGWTPLYANSRTDPADARLRAIKVYPISDRIGQRLEIALRDALNPSGIPTPVRYGLHTALEVGLEDLGIQSQGLAVRGELNVFATIVLTDEKSGASLLTNTLHVVNSFEILGNGYATHTGEVDAARRTDLQLTRDIVARLTLFMQQRAKLAAK